MTQRKAKAKEVLVFVKCLYWWTSFETFGNLLLLKNAFICFAIMINSQWTFLLPTMILVKSRHVQHFWSVLFQYFLKFKPIVANFIICQHYCNDMTFKRKNKIGAVVAMWKETWVCNYNDENMGRKSQVERMKI